ncbi:MAG: hypothetical protein H6742_07935 [Alphaproteobacteria bacterium]|nr:hypothetical protein [Alphaproteobacteria bacterium]
MAEDETKAPGPDSEEPLPRVAKVEGMQWVSPDGEGRMSLRPPYEEDDRPLQDTSAYGRPSAKPPLGKVMSPRGASPQKTGSLVGMEWVEDDAGGRASLRPEADDDGDPQDTSAYRRPSPREKPGPMVSPRTAGRSGSPLESAVQVVPVQSVRTAVGPAKPAAPAPPVVPAPAPEPLPRVELLSSPGPKQRCPVCKGMLRVIRSRREARLDARWYRFEWLDIDRGFGDCPKCPSVPTRRLEEPAYAIADAPIGNGLLAWVLTWRWQDHMQGPEIARALRVLGVRATDTDISRWLRGSLALLAPVADAVRQEAAKGQADARGVPMLDGGSEGVLRGRVTARAVAFDWEPGDVGPGPGDPEERAFAALQDARGWSRAGRQAMLRRKAAHALSRDPASAAPVAWRLEELRSAADHATEQALLGALARDVERATARGGIHPHLRDIADRLDREVDHLRRFGPKGPLPPPPLPENARFAVPTWLVAGGDGDAAAVTAGLSLAASCAQAQVPTWSWFRDSLDAAARDELGDGRKWTPAARA